MALCTTSAANSMSEMVTTPSLLVEEQRFAMLSSGKRWRHTISCLEREGSSQNTPNLRSEAFQNPRRVVLLWTVGKTLAGYKRGRPLPVLPRMGRPLPVFPRIRPRLPRGTQRVTHDGMPRQTSTSTRAVRVARGDMPSQ